ncbi:MAG: phosphotransferase [Desulfobacteraceae bacterium]|jgi:aminoglycoside/choline kinase family phosphotransferase
MERPEPELSEFIATFLKDMGLPGEGLQINSLPSDGSKRRFWRLSPQSYTSFIAIENPPTNDFAKRENVSYLMIGRHLFQKDLPVPEIHRFDLTNGWFIMDDFGNASLQDSASVKEDRVSIYERVVEILFRLQTEGAEGFNTEWCCQTERYDPFVMQHYEVNYFKDAFLHKYLGLKKDWPELEVAFNHLVETASKADDHYFLHRDFQSRNIMLHEGKIGILDWQGGRLGPLAYDLASLLIDPYTVLSSYERDEIFQHYVRFLSKYESRLVEPFKRCFPYLAIQRNLQILGAFSFLSKVQGKPYFEDFISPALKSLQHLLEDLNDPQLSTLEETVNSLNPLG